MNRKLIGLLIAVIAFVVFLFLLPQPEAPEPDAWPVIDGNTFVLRGVRVFDGERVHTAADVLVTEGIVTAFSGKVPVPNGVPELAATGQTLLPALLDAHTHNFGASREEALRFGIGTQIDMFTAHTSLAAARTQRDSVERTEQADMWSAGTMVTAPGGHGTQFGMAIPTLDNPADSAAFVAERIAEGSDFIKFTVEDGSGWGNGLPTLDAETLAAAIAAAHAHSKLAVVHAGTAEEAALAVEAGADGLVHVFRGEMSPALLAAIVENDVFVIPTLTVMESLAGQPNGLVDDARLQPYIDPAQEDGLIRQFPGSGREGILTTALATVRALHDAGVVLLAGSDAPNPGTAHGVSLHRELELLVEAGLSPQAALASATSRVADAFNLPARGRIMKGARADLVLVAGNPLEDVAATRAITAVWKNGFRVQRARFDGATTETDLPKAPAVLGVFDDGADGWYATTDSIMGGASSVTLAARDGALVIDAEVKTGAPFPWAGAMRSMIDGGMAPTDASAFETLTIRIRGQGTVQLLFFSGASAQGVPAVLPVQLEGSWQDLALDLSGVAGLDLTRLRAVGLTAGPAPGAMRIELDEMVLR
ncbi:MAG: amidohydrolase family protein [Gammaproteobacteria bacterium]